MNELVINGKIVRFNNPNQIINMGGPWVGNLLIDNNQVSNNVIIDNVLLNHEGNKLYFIQYQELSKKQKENYFSVNYFDWRTRSTFKFEMKFEMIFLRKITPDLQLTYYEAFHDQDKTKEKTVKLKGINLIEVKS